MMDIFGCELVFADDVGEAGEKSIALLACRWSAVDDIDVQYEHVVDIEEECKQILGLQISQINLL